jgi:hypothetical protein
MPALVEADDEGLYVVKLRGAGQGDKALVAELVVGELARAAGLPVPELVLVEVDGAFGRAEPDWEIRELMAKSAGLNLGLDYLPGAAGYDPLARALPPADLASRVVLFDAFVLNVDRTPRNPNLLTWHGGTWLIDHGAALYFQHGWQPDAPLAMSDSTFSEVKDHVLLPLATQLPAAAAALQAALDDALFDRVLADVPDAWLEGDTAWGGISEHRAAYGAWLRARRAALPALVEEAERARTKHV